MFYLFILLKEIQHEKEAEEEHVTGVASVIGGRDEKPSDVINPLEKYMMILMQGKQEQVHKKQHISLTNNLDFSVCVCK